MINAFGYNPVPWVVFKLAKFLPASGAAPMNAPHAQGASSWQGQTYGQCGGTGSVTCSHCQGRGSWYTQPTTAQEVAQLQSCSY
jgi:DnaJ-class molecular chaperone